jgi:hypothetical protein
MNTNNTMADNSKIDWKGIKERYPNAVEIVGKDIGVLTDKGWVDEELGLVIPEICLFQLEECGAEVSNEAYLKTDEEYALFYEKAFKEVQEKL